LAIKFAELEWIRDRIGEIPLLLLDEVVAELDSRRRAYLLGRIDTTAQTLLTTTELDIFPSEFLQRVQVLEVINGQIAAHRSSRP
jgi:DNA replication and repair protein RecF